MSSEVSVKLQAVLWWITSIAVSVLCCSVLFVFFASYLVDVKASIRESDQRINHIEEREDRILNEIEILRKHGIPAATTSEAPAAIVTPEASLSTASPSSVPAEIPAPTTAAMPATAPAPPVSPPTAGSQTGTPSSPSTSAPVSAAPNKN